MSIDAYTKLLLEFDSDFSDSSASAHTVTSNGTPTIASGVAPTGFNNSAALGSGDYLTMDSDTDFDPGTGDFTIDWWQNMTSQPSTGGLFQTSVSQYAGITIITDSNVSAYLSSNGGSWDIAGPQQFATSVPTGEWHHYAITRNGTTFRLFQDGIQSVTFESAASIYPSTTTVQIGRYWHSWYIDSNITELRVSKGISRWDSNFTPPDKPYSQGDLPVIKIGGDWKTPVTGKILIGGSWKNITSTKIYKTDSWKSIT